MTYNTARLILPLSILLSLSSCKGQDNTTNKEAQSGGPAQGKIALKVDDRMWSVFQDQAGNHWFGSNGNGVICYDGKNSTRYTEDDGLVDNTIRGIKGDHLGNVFIQTPVGVSKYDGTTFTTLEIKSSEANEWKLEPNDLWFNCNGNPNDLYRYDGESLIELKLPRKDLNKAFNTSVKGLEFEGMNNSSYSVFGINKDKAGNLWIGTVVAGAYRYDGDSFLWFPEKELSTRPDGSVPGVRSIVEDKDGNFWLSNFISRYRVIEGDSALSYEKLPGIDESNPLFEGGIPYFTSGLTDEDGDLWATTYGSGVWKYDGEEIFNWQLKDRGTDVLIISIYEDNSGVIWLGTDNAGVYRFNGEEFEKFEL